MNILFNKVLKNKIIKLFDDYSNGCNEIILEFPLSIGIYHTLEYDNITNDLILHMFDLDFDYPYLYDDLVEEDKLRIYQILKGIKHLD